MSICIDTDIKTWAIDTIDTTCDAPGCWHNPVIVAGGGWHHKFCELHQAVAADLALHLPAFPGWYRVEHITSTPDRHAIASVHPL